MLVAALMLVCALALSVPAGALLLLTLAAGRRPATGTAAPDADSRPAVAVLVPAHNESRNVLPTIACLLPQMRAGDRLIVIADNCSDDTAELARQAGATVVERHNLAQRGKGFALAHGVDFLRAAPPAVVVVIDADCTVTPDAVARISSRCAETNCPVQMLNLMHAVPGSGVRLRILEFAMVVKNLVRPLGSYRLGGACNLMGTGMALPWGLMSTARLATGHIAEDMKLGVDMALAGHPPQFYLDAEVSSAFPEDSEVARVQKSRWEHGHLTILSEELPRMVGAALRGGKPALYVLALDLVIPPLALYALVLGTAFVVVGLASLFLSVLVMAAEVLLMAVVALFLSVGLAWSRYGRHLLSARELFSTPFYAVWKIPVYVAYALKRRSGWVRTKRKSE
jgi:glycosyltransferase involved in cell wall biosynthesis